VYKLDYFRGSQTTQYTRLKLF